MYAGGAVAELFKALLLREKKMKKLKKIPGFAPGKGNLFRVSGHCRGNACKI